MSNYMITQEEFIKEQFIDKKIHLDGSVKAFLNYFVAILLMVRDMGIISDERRDSIFGNIALAFESKSKNNIIITNIMYVLSAWLKSMDLYTAWKELDSIKNLDSAVETLEKSKDWYKRQILEMKSNLLASEKSIRIIDNEKLKISYEKLFNLLGVLEKYDLNPQFSLKSEHVTNLNSVFLPYSFITEDYKQEDSVIESLKKIYYNFLVEIRIFAKLNGKEFVVFSKEEYDKSETEKAIEEMELNEKYEELLKQADEEYKDALAEARKFDIRFEKMTKQEQEKIPVEEFEHYDVVRIEREFIKKKEKIKKEWDYAEDALNKNLDQIRDMEGSLVFQADMPSLLYTMQEFALWSLAKKGVIEYPQTRAQKGIMLDTMPLSTVIAEVLEKADAIGLTDCEFAYLKKVM